MTTDKELEKIVGTVPYLNRYALFLTKNPHDAEDLVSMTIVRVLEKVRGENLCIRNPKAFLRLVMRQVFVREFYQKKRVVCTYDDAYMAKVQPDQTAKASCAQIMRLVDEKPQPDKTIILDYVNGHSITDISGKYRGFRTGIGTIAKIINNFKSDALCVI